MAFFKGVQLKGSTRGRTLTADGILWLCQSGAGVRFTVSGTFLKIRMVPADVLDEPGGHLLPRAAVEVDGVRKYCALIPDAGAEITVFRAETPEIHEISVIKLSECRHSLLGITGLETDAETLRPVPLKERKMEIIGDSITCGFGVDDPLAESVYTTATEDCSKAFGFRLAWLLNAEVNLVSYSGFGVLSGYTPDPEIIGDDQLVPKYYETTGMTAAKEPEKELPDPEEVPWDFHSYEPQLVIIFLGTNDECYTQGREERKLLFARKYTDFVKTVRRRNPGAQILCVLGLMKTELVDEAELGLHMAAAETGDRKMHFLRLSLQLPGDGVACGHPTVITHYKTAETIAVEVRKILPW